MLLLHTISTSVLPATVADNGCRCCCWQVVEKPAGQGWAEKFGAAAAGPSAGWASEFHQQQQQGAGPVPQRDWADEFAAGVANINLNTEELTDEQLEAAWAAVGGGLWGRRVRSAWGVSCDAMQCSQSCWCTGARTVAGGWAPWTVSTQARCLPSYAMCYGPLCCVMLLSSGRCAVVACSSHC
jgi:hypothetical protein